MVTLRESLLDPNVSDYSPWRVGLSMAASWSMGVSMAAGLSLLSLWGFAPFLIWCITNTLAIPLFSVVYTKFPQFREFINFRIGMAIMLFVALAQITLNQTALRQALGPGVDFQSVGIFNTQTPATAVTMVVSISLFLFVFKYGLPGSVTTDVLQYASQFFFVGAIAVTGIILGFDGVDVPTTADTSVWLIPATIGLLSGPFVDPMQWQRLEKQPKLETGLWGGVFFGAYIWTVAFAATVFGTNSFLHAVLFAIVVLSVATSSLDSIASALQRLLGTRLRGLVVGLVGIGVFPFAGVIGVGEAWSIFVDYRARVVAVVLGLVVLLTVGRHVFGDNVHINKLKTPIDFESSPMDPATESSADPPNADD